MFPGFSVVSHTLCQVLHFLTRPLINSLVRSVFDACILRRIVSFDDVAIFIAIISS